MQLQRCKLYHSWGEKSHSFSDFNRLKWQNLMISLSVMSSVRCARAFYYMWSKSSINYYFDQRLKLVLQLQVAIKELFRSFRHNNVSISVLMSRKIKMRCPNILHHFQPMLCFAQVVLLFYVQNSSIVSPHWQQFIFRLEHKVMLI